MDAVFGVDNCKKNLRRGKYGIEVVLDYLKKARDHPTWNADELLALKLERIYQCFEESGAVITKDPPKPPNKPKSTAKATSASSLSKEKPCDPKNDSSVQNLNINSKETPADPIPKPTTNSGPSKKRKTDSKQEVHDIDFKLKVMKWHEDNKATQQETARKFKINQTSLSQWLKLQPEMEKRLAYNGGRVKRQRTAAYPELEQALFNWFLEAQSRQMPINDKILRTKAQKFGNILQIDLNFLNGWLFKFKNRFRISQVQLHGEAGSVDKDLAKAARKELLSITRPYKACNIYNADETGLLYKMPPNKTLATKTCSGLKGAKVQLTYHFCCNADGSDKLEPLVIGNAQKPRCFGKKPASYWGGHTKAVEGLSLTNLEVHFFPPNLTSVLQPCDAGIIQAFKAYY
ncbi:hypothetical protein PCASD_00281 [Puccinia coronata f. sp. avenae]|uniref:HTH CENPB-type domain-containing protein n=1 Tax=Puccinia coronata f. sp. avenae TaxID=200324 RepID=A0A2N5VN45_9BASI|nr:hypothetical protein PCASD_00281 [Puccinia coronata f. sp. avenae]